MEEKKFDINSLIGFILIGGILVWMLYQQAPTQEELDAEKAKTEQIEKAKKEAEKTTTATVDTALTSQQLQTTSTSDSLQMEQLKNRLGSFAYAASLPSAVDKTTTLENDLIELKINNKGGYIEEATLKNYKTFDSIPVYLIKDGNASFNIQFQAENRTLNTKDLFFEPTMTKNGENTVLSMKLKVSADKYLEYRYEIKPGDYMLDFAIQTRGLSDVINTSEDAELEWQLKTYRK